MFRKLVKCFLSLTLVSGLIASVYYLYKNYATDDLTEDATCSDMDTFHLDSDLEPITKREYVPLNRAVTSDDTTEDADKTTLKDADESALKDVDEDSESTEA